jgi:peptidoglycan/xylan/chitin deacetylase (PgdA/CDA1 family)
MLPRRAHLKWLYFTVLSLLGREAALLQRIVDRDLIVVLNLHQVSPHSNPFWSPMHPRMFEDLLVFLKRHFEVTTFGNVAAAGPGKPKAIISFDDGYHSFVEYAMPMLHKHGLRANQNVIPACIETGLAPWNVRLCDFLNSAPRRLIDEIRLPGFSARLSGDGPDRKMRYGIALCEFLKARPKAERDPLWISVEAVMQKGGNPDATRMMNCEETLQATASHEIGAHSYSHESMGFESNEFFEADLRQCVRYFDQRLRLPLSIYAFPNGSHREEQFPILSNNGVRHILIVGEQFASGHGSVYSRFTICGETCRETRFQALGCKALDLPGNGKGTREGLEAGHSR